MDAKAGRGAQAGFRALRKVTGLAATDGHDLSGIVQYQIYPIRPHVLRDDRAGADQPDAVVQNGPGKVFVDLPLVNYASEAFGLAHVACIGCGGGAGRGRGGRRRLRKICAGHGGQTLHGDSNPCRCRCYGYDDPFAHVFTL